MLTYGKNITEKNDLLQKISIEKLHKHITAPQPDLLAKIKQLRTVITLDENKYRKLKTFLPYFCCGIFLPPYRKTDHFAHIQYFVVDIDHLREKDLTNDFLKDKLKSDQQIVLAFDSPSNNGVKVMFKLSKPCYDKAKFSIFYKMFAQQFSKKFDLEQVIDTRTCDVTRACFLSVDPDALFNPEALPVSMEQIIDFEDPFQVREAEKTDEEKLNKRKDLPADKNITPTDNNELMTQIRARLNDKARIRHEKHIYVPEKLNTIIEKAINKLKEYDIETTGITNIHYGKKFRVQLNNMWAEVNVFYGKKGFSIVKTPKRGSNAELSDITQKILGELLIT